MKAINIHYCKLCGVVLFTPGLWTYTDNTVITTSSCMIYNVHIPNCELVPLAHSLPLQVAGAQVCIALVHCVIALISVYPVKTNSPKTRRSAWIQDIKWSVLYLYFNLDKRNLNNFYCSRVGHFIVLFLVRLD